MPNTSTATLAPTATRTAGRDTTERETWQAWCGDLTTDAAAVRCPGCPEHVCTDPACMDVHLDRCPDGRDATTWQD